MGGDMGNLGTAAWDPLLVAPLRDRPALVSVATEAGMTTSHRNYCQLFGTIWVNSRVY